MILILTLLLASFVTYAADLDKSDKKVTLRFMKGNEDNLPKLETRVSKIEWAPAIKNLANNPDVQSGEIPLHNVDVYTFNCLSNLVTISENPTQFIDPAQEKVKEIKERFSKKLQINNHGTMVNPHDALVQADCLEMHPKFKLALASFCTQWLQHPTISNVTPDLEPSISGWILHDMIKGCKAITKTKNIGSMENSISQIIMSNASPKGGIVCLWEQVGSDSVIGPKSNLWTKATHLNFADNGQPIVYDLGSLNITSNSRCAFSDDERWLLVTQNPSFIKIYDLEKLKNIHLPKDKRTVFSLDLSDLQICEPDIVDILYNDKINEHFKMKGFEIIIHKNRMKKESCSGCGLFLVTILILTSDSNPSDAFLDRVVKRLTLDSGEPLHLSAGVRWSCVRGNLVGVSTITEDGALLYKDGKLHHCFFDKEEERWIYQIGDKKCDANFEVINGGLCMENSSKIIHHCAISRSFIPYLNDVLPVYNQPWRANSQPPTGFNPHPLCFTESTFRIGEVGNLDAKIIYLLPPKLLDMMHFLQNKIDRGNPKILADSLAIKYYCENPATWRTQCNAILEHISPYIREKLEEPEESNSGVATSLLSWCTIS